MAMLCHDTWFFLHKPFYEVRRWYKNVHVTHHSLDASCSVLGNAYANAIDIDLCFVRFHPAPCTFYLCHQQIWTPLAEMALVMAEAVTDIAGEPPRVQHYCNEYSLSTCHKYKQKDEVHCQLHAVRPLLSCLLSMEDKSLCLLCCEQWTCCCTHSQECPCIQMAATSQSYGTSFMHVSSVGMYVSEDKHLRRHQQVGEGTE